MSRKSPANPNIFIAKGCGVRAVGRPLTHTFESYEELRDDLENLGIKLSYLADRQLSGGLHATVQCDERTLCLLGVWDPQPACIELAILLRAGLGPIASTAPSTVKLNRP